MKTKKFAALLLSCLLIASMAFSSAISAFAVDAQKPEQIDKEKKITLDLFKKDDFDVTEGETTKEGNPVAGATYSAYPVLNYDFADKTYSIDGTLKNAGIKINSIIKKDDGTEDKFVSYGTTTELEAQISMIEDYIRTTPVTTTHKATTDPAGVASFTDLTAGVYLIVETTPAPHHVVSTQSFLVTLPEYDEDDKNNDGLKWNYHVTAKPKNKNITVDKTFKASDSDNQVKADSFEIGDVVDYTIVADIPDYGMSTDDPKLSATNYLALGQKIVQVLDDNEQPIPETDADGKIVRDENGEIVYKTKTVVDEKAVEKFNALNVVMVDRLSEGLTFMSDKDVKLEVIDPKDDNKVLKELTKDEVLKAITGATKGEDGKVTLKIDEDTKADYTFAKGTEKVENSDKTLTKLTVNVSWAALNEYQGKALRLTYSAKLNDKAFITDSNKNTVNYYFSQDPKVITNTFETEKDTDKEPADPSETDVYTYEMDLDKYFNGEAVNVFADENKPDPTKVVFYMTNNAGVEYNFIKYSDGKYAIWTDENAVQKDENNDTYVLSADDKTKYTYTPNLSPNKDGKLTIKGLKAGEYRLIESATASGYSILTGPVVITVMENTDDDGKVINGNVIAEIYRSENSDGKSNGEMAKIPTAPARPDAPVEPKIEEYYRGVDFEGAHDKWEIEKAAYDKKYPANETPTELDKMDIWDDNAYSELKSDYAKKYIEYKREYENAVKKYEKYSLTQVKGNEGAFHMIINNPKSQFNLPETGGFGLLIFTIGGAVVFAVAIIIFTSVRKKKSNQ